MRSHMEASDCCAVVGVSVIVVAAAAAVAVVHTDCNKKGEKKKSQKID